MVFVPLVGDFHLLFPGVELVSSEVFVSVHQVIVDGVGLVLKLLKLEGSIVIGNFISASFDSLSMVYGLSGDHEPMGLLGEGLVVREIIDVLHELRIDFTRESLEDGSPLLFIISSLKFTEHFTHGIVGNFRFSDSVTAGTESSFHLVDVHFSDIGFNESAHVRDNSLADTSTV